MEEHVRLAKKLSGEGRGKWFVELELDSPELRALGHVTAQWSYLEHTIRKHSEFLAKHAGMSVPPDVRAVSLQKRRAAWQLLAETALKNDPDLPKVLKIISRVGSMEAHRHRFIHGVLRWDRKNRENLNLTTRQNPHGAPIRTSRRRIDEFAHNVAMLTAELLQVHGPLRPAVGASPRRVGRIVPARPFLPTGESTAAKSALPRRRQR